MSDAHPAERPGPVSYMAGHSVAANLVMLLCIIGGGIALYGIRQEVFPARDPESVEVSVAYPGASPEEVESGIILAIEEAVRAIDGVDEVVGLASEGNASVTVELITGTDVNQAAQDIQSEIDRIRTFPEDAEEPVVRALTSRREVCNVILYGPAEDHTLHELGEQLRDDLLQDPDITQVDVVGLPPLEIAVEISMDNLRRYGLSLEAVADALRAASVDLPGGGVKTPSGELLLRVKERRDFGRQFARLPILTTESGAEVLLEDIATVVDGFEDADRYTRFDGQPAIELEIYRVGDQTPIQVSEAVRRHLADAHTWLPTGIATTIRRDRSDIYRQRVELLVRNGAIGLVLVFCLLGLFLEARLAFWVMMGIPISFLGSFLILPATGVTLNMVSLFAYIIALGIVVDDAIVVGENVYHHHQEGLPFLDAAVLGAREVAMPVTFSILTNIVTFIPIYFVPGFIGQIFRMIPIVVCTVFLISLGESLLILPAHLGHQREREPGKRGVGPGAWLHRRQQAFSRQFRHWVRDWYGPFLSFTLRHRYLTITIAVALLAVALSYPLSGRMGFGLFPVVESDYSQAAVVLPYGAPVARTEAVMRRVLAGAEAVMREYDQPELFEGITTDIGRGGSHQGTMNVELAAPEVRQRIARANLAIGKPPPTTEEFTRRWRNAVGEIVGVESLRFRADVGGPGSRGRPVAVELSHRNLTVLEQASVELAAELAEYPRAADVDDGYQPGKEQLDFTVKPEGRALGLTARAVARQVRNAFYGAEAVRQQRGRNEIRLRVRLPEAERVSEHTIEQLLIRTPAGTWVPFNEVAVYRRGRAYTAINRRQGRRVLEVSADVTPRDKAGEILADLKAKVLPALIARHPGLSYSFEGHQADIRESLGSLRYNFLIALMVIYALLAVPFRSYVQPLIVMFSIPFGLVGAVIGHLLMGYSLSVMSMFGIVALAGVVVNDSLVMVDFANRRRLSDRDLGAEEAVHSAAIQRFRPIMLTTLTTFGGLSPMIFETSRQARFLIPMALSLGFGIVFATVITLVIVPSLYVAADDARGALAAVRWFLFPPRTGPRPSTRPARSGDPLSKTAA